MYKKPEKTIHQLQLKGQIIQVQAIRERRANLRAGVGKNGLILRIPKGLNQSQQHQAWDWFTTWAETTLNKHPEIFLRLSPKQYLNGDILEVGARTYHLLLESEVRKSSTARLLPGRTIHLILNQEEDAFIRHKTIKTLVSRIIAADFLPEIRLRVQELNHLYFKKNVRDVRLTYQSSKWGSCSSLGNIRLSTRLLFAPTEVIDYVILHELAHLVEMNHSASFWKILQEIMPDYKEKEKWLKKYSHQCDF